MKNVIACVDGSKLTENVLNASVWAAQRMEAPLVLLHALEKASASEYDLSGTIGLGSREHLLEELTELDEKRAKVALEHGKVLLEYAQAFTADKGLETSQLQRHGNFVDTLNELSDDARLFVVGKQGTGHLDSNVIGSNLENAARSLHQPLLVVSDEFSQPERFMVAYDGRETAKAALERIAQSPLLKGIPCHLVMVDRSKGNEAVELDQARAKLVDLGFEVEAKLIEGDDIQAALLTYQRANQIDLIVMGAYAHSKVRQFFVGSNTSKMLAQCQVPVIILR